MNTWLRQQRHCEFNRKENIAIAAAPGIPAFGAHYAIIATSTVPADGRLAQGDEHVGQR